MSDRDCYEILPNGKRALVIGDGDSELDVFIQDQTTTPYHFYMMTEDQTGITLTSPVSTDDMVLNVSAGHGFSIGDYLVIAEGDLFEQAEVVGVNVNEITISLPFANPFTLSAEIVRGRTDLSFDGSVTPVDFYAKIYGSGAIVPIDIIGAKITIVHESAGDFSLFGNLSALTNGLFLRKTDGENTNLGNYKTNQDFENYGFHVRFDDRAGGGGEYSTIATINIKEFYGVALRMRPDSSDYFLGKIRDKLDTLISLKIMIFGHFTAGENL